MGLIENLIYRFKNRKKVFNIDDLEHNKVDKNAHYKYRDIDYEYFDESKKDMSAYRNFFELKNEGNINVDTNKLNDIGNNENNFEDLSFKEIEDKVEKCLNNINIDCNNNSKDEKIVNITNEIYSRNKTNSPYSVETYTPEKQNEEFFYDFDNKAKLGLDTDADRNSQRLVDTSKCDFDNF